MLNKLIKIYCHKLQIIISHITHKTQALQLLIYRITSKQNVPQKEPFSKRGAANNTRMDVRPQNEIALFQELAEIKAQNHLYKQKQQYKFYDRAPKLH